MDEPSRYDPPRLGCQGCAATGILGVLLAWCLLLSTCVSEVVVARTTSPDGRVVATVTEVDAGATVDFAYDVRVFRNWPWHWDYSVARLYGAVRSECAYGVDLKWIGSDTLMISYKEAKDADIKKSIDLIGRTIKIVHRPGVDTSSVPCGAMEADGAR